MDRKALFVALTVILLTFSWFTLRNPLSEKVELNSAEKTVKQIGKELSKDRPDYREIYKLISKNKTDVRSFSYWKNKRDQLYGTYRTTGMKYEFEGIVNSTVTKRNATVWWRVINHQSDPKGIYLKKTKLVKNNSGWLLAEDVKISEAAVNHQ